MDKLKEIRNKYDWDIGTFQAQGYTDKKTETIQKDTYLMALKEVEEWAGGKLGLSGIHYKRLQNKLNQLKNDK